MAKRTSMLALLALVLSACGGSGAATTSATSGTSSTGSGGAGGAGGAGATGGSASSSTTDAAASSAVSSAVSSAASSTSASGASTSSSSGGTACALSDEFDDPATLAACWKINNVVEGTAPKYTTLDVDTATPGALTLIPTLSVWYNDEEATLVYKEITGDFVLETHALARGQSDPAGAPKGPFNSAGMVARDPAKPPGQHDWLMYDVGFQKSFVGTEGKTTVGSMSVYELLVGTRGARLSLCRMGSVFRMSRQLDGESTWTLTETYDRPDLPQKLQVGLIANAYMSPDIRAEFDYARFTVPASVADCTPQ